MDDRMGRTDLYNRYRTAELLFSQRRYAQAALLLEELLQDLQDLPEQTGTGEARLLLARAYYHSAQLGRAERAARELVAADPSDPYAVLLLGRVLCRQARGDEGKGWLRRAEALGLTV
ncbi:MAG TPA: tetratricopeptide repeat protein [Dermatophilaceae bacterium]|jgi:FMN reductase|nr:tetratricopeptide repeat protein [Dermatophilaceae bacterium]